MNLSSYDFEVSPDHFEYEFYSKGPKGLIRKLVRFAPFTIYGKDFINLGFGDWNEETQTMDDFMTTHNGDTDKVLVTVAYIVFHFTDRFLNSIIYIEGSTPSRTRLYQMTINRNFEIIRELFDLFGFPEADGMQPFSHGVNYLAFLVKRKQFK